MRSLLNWLTSLFRTAPYDEAFESPFDPETIAAQIKEQERERSVEPGRRIHHCRYRGFDLFLDMDITLTYRITAYRDRERVYSFTVYCDQGSYDELTSAYRRIAFFLEGRQKPAELPDDDRIKGFYFGG